MWSRITALLDLQLSDDAQLNKSARNLSVLLFIVLFGSVIAVFVRLITLRQVDAFSIIFSGIFLSSLGFIWMVRRGMVSFPSYALPLIFLAAFIHLSASDNGLHDNILPGFVLVILLAGLLLGRRGVLIFTVLIMLSVVGIGIGELSGVLVSPLSETTTVGVIVLVSLQFGFIGLFYYLVLNNLLTSVVEARSANAELQKLSQTLETQVNERVRELTLATQAGNQIAQLHDLEVVLHDAVTLVQELFHLYYVQIYLMDESGKRLVIQSGTGFAGRQLVAQQHALSVNRLSLNGQAVVERRVVFVEDTAVNPTFLPNPLLPDTRSEMAVPLIIGDQVLGVLNLQDNKIGTLTEDGVPVFQTLANQLAVAIQNANLFEELVAAQREVENTARRLTRESWEHYLDGMNNPQKFGVQYAGNQVQPLKAPMTPGENGNSLQVPVLIANEPLGMIAVAAKANQSFDEQTVAMITAVSQQISQQIENLRLLGEAERYRSEAEIVTKRLVREAWKTFQADALSNGFEYDQNQIKPITSTEEELLNTDISAPLDIQGEMIGQLFLEGVNAEDENAYYLVGVIADHLSAHIENIRLSQQTEIALAESQRQREELAVINEIASRVAAQLDTKALLQSVLEQLKRVLPTDSFTVASYDRALKQIRFLLVYDAVNGYQYDLPPKTVKETDISYGVIHSKKAKLLLYSAEEVAEHKQNRPDNLISKDASITASLIFAPMMRGDDVMGVISIQSYDMNAYKQSDLDLFMGVANYVATGIQNAQLFSEIQSQSEKERIINVITQKIQDTNAVEDALQTAVFEIGNALKARYTRIKLESTNTLANQQNGTTG